MRVFRLVVFCSFACLFSISTFALDLRVRVVDPSSAAVSGARVAVYAESSRQPLALGESDAQGAAVFHNLKASLLRVEVLAPGFAPLTIAAKGSGDVTAQLKLASQSETVVVSAAPSPVEAGLTGLNVSTLDSATLTTLQPIAASDAIRFLPGVILGDTGNRGGQTSLFVRGGDSDYNKVLIDGVPVGDPGGYFDFGTTSMAGADRLELMRGSESVLYGSDAMSSVLQINSAIGHTRIPELRFGGDGGNFGTAHGFASLSGARGRYDYNLFGDQFNSNGQGANDDYGNSTQGANLGLQLSPDASVRLHVRHNDSHTGVPGETTFLGQQLLPPVTDTFARQNNLLASLVFNLAAPGKWQHQFTVYNYNHQRHDIDTGVDTSESCFPFCAFSDVADINRFGVRYNGEHWESTRAKTSFGYEFEDENGSVGDTTAPPPLNHGLRLNHAVYGEQFLQMGRLTGIVGARFVHNQSFGNRAVPRASLTYLLSRGNQLFTGTRLKGSYSEGIKEPKLEQSFGEGFTGFKTVPNPNLKAEEARSLEAGVEQRFGSKIGATATYFNTLYRNQITTIFLDSSHDQFINLNKALAHGAELDLSGRIHQSFQLQGSYFYTSTQILGAASGSISPFAKGDPLLRRPKHAGTLLLAYSRPRYGATLGGSFLGRRPDSDFEFPPLGFTHAAGYARVDAGGWYQLDHHVTLYANVENLLNKHYEEVLGYPALTASFRAGMRFRFGGE
jgi:vitamin B12 transporter